MRKKRILKDIDVNFISLVRKGANNKVVILKSEYGPPDFEKQIEIAKTIDGVVYGVVYAPDEVDSQGDSSSASEIKKAAYKFMQNEAVHQIDRDHNGEAGGAYLAESWIIRKSDSLFPNEKPGAWAVGLKLTDANLIADVQKGKITGLSMAGRASVEHVQKEDGGLSSFAKSFADALRGSGKQDTDTTEAVADILKTMDAITKSIGDINARLEGYDPRMERIEDAQKLSKQDTKAQAKPDAVMSEMI